MPQARAAVIADDPRQFEMGFNVSAHLQLDSPSAEEASQVELALSDLEQLEVEAMKAAESTNMASENVTVG